MYERFAVELLVGVEYVSPELVWALDEVAVGGEETAAGEEEVGDEPGAEAETSGAVVSRPMGALEVAWALRGTGVQRSA